MCSYHIQPFVHAGHDMPKQGLGKQAELVLHTLSCKDALGPRHKDKKHRLYTADTMLSVLWLACLNTSGGDPHTAVTSTRALTWLTSQYYNMHNQLTSIVWACTRSIV